jgi:peptidoglycan hydrolase-like protein with peptidoglycan-binding domain
MKGPDVLGLQTALNAHNFSNAQDGIYGPFTQALVAQFQTKSGLKPDAVVGPQTWDALLA